MRSERALTLALAETYVQGVSMRKAKAYTEQFGGTSISWGTVSQAASLLDGELEKWRNRRLGEYRYPYLDVCYEHVRLDGCVRDLAILVGVGVNVAGKLEIFGCIRFSE